MKRSVLALFLVVVLIFPYFQVLAEEKSQESEDNREGLMVEVVRELLVDDMAFYFSEEILVDEGFSPEGLVEDGNFDGLEIEIEALEFLGFLDSQGELLENLKAEDIRGVIRLRYQAKAMEEEKPPRQLSNEAGLLNYDVIPLGLSLRSFSGDSSRLVEKRVINSSGSWAFYHAWDKTGSAHEAITSTFAYFVLDDGSIGFCLDPTKAGPSGSLPVEAFASSSFRRFAENVSTLAIASGGIPGYSFEENFVFAQMYIWQNIPFNDGSGQRYQVDFRYQNSQFERNEETHARYMAWKTEIDSRMSSLGKISFDGEELKLRLGEELVINDGNAQLAKYNIKGSIEGLEVRREGNDLIVKATKPLKGKLEFWQARGDYPLPEVSFILKGHDNSYQDLGVFRDPYVAVLHFEALQEDAKVKVLKKNRDGLAIAGAVFEISSKRDFSQILDILETDGDGLALSKDLNIDLSRVYIREKSVPHPYAKSNRVEEVVLEAGKTHSFEYVNDYKTARIRIIKNTQQGQPIKGAVFELAEDKAFKNILTSLTSSEKGEVVFDGIDVSKYPSLFIREVSVPEPYILNSNPVELKLLAGEEIVKTFVNEAKTVTLKKTDIVTGEAVEGALIEIGFPDGSKREYLSDSQGRIALKELSSGQYSFREILSPRGYVLNPETFTFTLLEDGSVKGTREFENEPVSLRIEKKDLDGRWLEGADFVLTFNSGERLGEKVRADWSEGRYIASAQGEREIYRSDGKGPIIIDYLPPGDYLLSEVRAPEGYILDTSPRVLRIDSQGHIEGDLHFENRPTEVVLSKKDLVTGEAVQGALIVISDKSGRSWEYTTDEEGLVKIEGLVPGIYEFREKLAPQGYVLNEESFSFELRADGSLDGVRDFTNEPSRFRLVKKDRGTGEALSGASFKLIFSQGERKGQAIKAVYDNKLKKYIAKEDGDEILTTDDQGEIILDYLPKGKYQLVEIAAPKGYILGRNPEDRSLEIVIDDRSGLETSPYEFLNDKSRIIIDKVDGKTGEPLEGAEFSVTAKGFSKRVTSDEKGQILLEGLVAGSYKIKEERAPEGYIINEKVYIFTLDEYGQLGGVKDVKNEATRLIIKKVDENNRPLAGVGFEIRDRKDEVIRFRKEEEVYLADKRGEVETVTSDEDGLVIIDYLAQGSYVIREISAPEGYSLARDKRVRLKNHGQASPLLVEIVNRRPLPKTGENRSGYFLLLGFSLLLGAGFISFSLRRS